MSLFRDSTSLPLCCPSPAIATALLYAVEEHQVTVLIGQTGSGKTTQLPQYLDQAGWCSDGKLIAVAQACMAPSTLAAYDC